MSSPAEVSKDDKSNQDANADDSDEELLLKGSELETLASALRDDVEVYSPRQWVRGVISPNHSETTSRDESCVDLLALKEMVLKSGLMLDEDMTLVLNTCSDHNLLADHLHRMGGVTLCGSSVVACFSCYQIITHYNWGAAMLLFSSIGLTLFLSYWINQRAMLQKTTQNLLSKTAELLTFIKKTFVSLKEAYTVVNSKSIEAKFRRSSPEVVDRYYTHVKSDIASCMEEYATMLTSMILVFRDATRDILSSWSPPYSSDAFFVALRPENELNIPNYEEMGFDSDTIRMLEDQNSHLIVMQSEYLRSLATCFFLARKSDRRTLHLMLKKHEKMINERLGRARQHFKGRLYSEFADKTPSLVAEKKDMRLIQLESKLSSVLYELTSVKFFLQHKSHVTPADRPYLQFCYENIRRATVEFSLLYDEMFIDLGKDCEDETKLRKNGQISLMQQSSTIKVDEDSHSFTEEDRVYLGMPDFDDSSGSIMSQDEFNPPSFPVSLMHELKGRLEEKRVEFKQRESDAVNKSDLANFDQQFDLVALNKPLIDQSGQLPTNDDLSTEIMTQLKNRRKAQLGGSRQQEDAQSFQPDLCLAKSVAASAALTSTMWDLPEEECFGDGEEDSINENGD